MRLCWLGMIVVILALLGAYCFKAAIRVAPTGSTLVLQRLAILGIRCRAASLRRRR